MQCGSGVSLCGVLTLETGFGGGTYRHGEPVVHGLWPQVGRFGNSECLSPKDAAAPHMVYQCYDQKGESFGRNLGFERHEWNAHGKCAGAADAEDFFGQVCSLAEAPLRVMAGARAAGLDDVDTAEQLQRSGFCVWGYGSNAQVELSACAGRDGRWKLADATEFGEVCGSAASFPVCVPNHHGPRCHTNQDCLSLAGCARCARSGFCTAQPLLGAELLSTELANATLEEFDVAAAREGHGPEAVLPAPFVAFAAFAAMAMGLAVGLAAFLRRPCAAPLTSHWLATEGDEAKAGAYMPAPDGCA